MYEHMDVQTVHVSVGLIQARPNKNHFECYDSVG